MTVNPVDLIGIAELISRLQHYETRSYDPAPEEFSEILTQTMNLGMITSQQLALQRKVSASTVGRWIDGTSTPPPMARRVILTELWKFVQQIIT